jgi:undecaprenyl pyrophosphate phosphatase UppP
LIAIAFLIRYVRTRNYVAFAVYRLLVAALVIAVFFARG